MQQTSEKHRQQTPNCDTCTHRGSNARACLWSIKLRKLHAIRNYGLALCSCSACSHWRQAALGSRELQDTLKNEQTATSNRHDLQQQKALQQHNFYLHSPTTTWWVCLSTLLTARRAKMPAGPAAWIGSTDFPASMLIWFARVLFCNDWEDSALT